MRDKTVRKRKAKDYGRVLSSAAAKGTKSLWFHVGKKEEKENEKKQEKERERKSFRRREEIPEGWKWFQSSSVAVAFSSCVSISEVAHPPLFWVRSRREPRVYTM